MPVLETDFLLGLRKKDKKYGLSASILEIAKMYATQLRGRFTLTFGKKAL